MNGRTTVGFVWRVSHLERGEQMTAALTAALGDLGVATKNVLYADDTIDENRREMRELDGVLVWVNPIQDGATRASLDPLLRELASDGVWVSAHPDTILRMGTKEVLYRTRDLGCGTDVALYRDARDLARRLPDRLTRHRALVVKQGRGTAGEGVWKIESRSAADRVVRIQEATASAGDAEETTLDAFVARCAAYFAWSGCVIDQPFVERLGDGMVRAYLSQDTVVGFCHQWPKGLLDAAGEARRPTTRAVMEDPSAGGYQVLRTSLEREWVPAMMQVLGLGHDALPAIWDADFLYGPKTATGEDTWTLCEINVSAVWPFPPQGAPFIASTVVARLRARSHA